MGETVGQRVARVIITAAVLVLLVGSVGVLGLFVTTRSVDRLVDNIEPARQANDGVLQNLTDADAGIRGWAISGDQAALVPFFNAMDELPAHQSDLERFQPPVEDLDALLESQDEAIDTWIATYANPRLDAGPGQENNDPALFLRGRRAFEDLRAANDRIDQELASSAEDARASSARAWNIALAIMVLTILLGLAVVLGLGRSLVRGIQRPLRQLAEVVRRLAAGEDGVRASTDGLREVAAVGETVNVLAVENERGRAVEEDVHESLRELDRTKNDFVSNVSHELRTPLTSIRGYLELLEEDDEIGGPEREMWEAVNRNVNRLSLLIEDLLTLSKVETRGTELTELDLRDVVLEVVTDLKVVAARREVDVDVEFPTEPLRVLADQTQILRAVLNVVSNAVKFSRPGGWVRGRRRRRGRRRGGHRPGQRHRHPGGRAADRRAALLPRLQRRRPADRRHRAGHPDRADDHGAARRHGAVRVGRARGHHGAPADAPAGRRRCRCRARRHRSRKPSEPGGNARIRQRVVGWQNRSLVPVHVTPIRADDPATDTEETS